MIGNVINVGSSAWEDVRLLLQVVGKSDLVLAELQAKVNEIRESQIKLDTDASAIAEGWSALEASRTELAKLQDKVDKRVVTAQAKADSNKLDADALAAKEQAIEGLGKANVDKAVELANRKDELDAYASTLELAKAEVEDLKAAYLKKLADLKVLVA